MLAMAGASTSTSIRNTEISQFNGKNYDYWEITMRTMFPSQYLWEFVEDGFDEPVDENAFNVLTQAEKDFLKRNRKDSKALLYLYQALHESVFPRIVAAKISKDAWDTPKVTYREITP